MAISTTFTTAFKVDLLDGTFSGVVAESPNNTYKLAMFTSSATLDATTTAYAATNEVTDTSSPQGYTAGGKFLVVAQVPTSTSTTAWLDFEDLVFSSVTLTANGCLIYDTVNSNAAMTTHAFGSDKSASAGDFTVVFPTGDSTNAIIRIA